MSRSKDREEHILRERERVQLALAKINWSLKSRGCDVFVFVNQRGEEQPIELNLDRIQIQGENYNFTAYFYMFDVEIQEIQHGDKPVISAISFAARGLNGVFLNCQNFDK